MGRDLKTKRDDDGSRPMTDDEYGQLLNLRKRLAARAQELTAQSQFFQAAIWRAKATGVAMVIRKFPSESKRKNKIENSRRKRLVAKRKLLRAQLGIEG